MNVRPIETRYKDHYFRSRLEARWAVFFDALRLDWDYEVEGYILENGTQYLPDFWIYLDKESLPGWGFYIEIKATKPTKKEREKLYLLSKETGHTCMFFWGKPTKKDWSISVYKRQMGGSCWIEDGKYNSDLACIAEETHESGKTYPIFKINPLPFGYRWYITQDSTKRYMLEDAFKKASFARFEFGEEG